MHPTRIFIALTTALMAGMACGQDPQSGLPKHQPAFRDADFTHIAEVIGPMIGRRFVLDPGVCAIITATWETPMTDEEFYQEFLVIVRALGFVAVEQDSITRIMLDEHASKESQRSCRQYPAI